jgi:hypothetical protein
MKKTLISTITIALLLCSNISFSQTLNLGILSSFEAYTGEGAVTNAGTLLTGDVGTNIGIVTGCLPPNFVGNVYNADAVTDQCRFDLLRIFVHLNDLFVDYPGTHAPAFGSGETIAPGVYSTGGAGSLAGALTLDGGGDPNAFFVIKSNGAFTAGVGSTVNLINGAKACNVFWIAEGAISIGAGSVIKGTLFAHIGAVSLGANVDLEGKIWSFAGAITVGAGSVATGPACISTIPIFCEQDCTPASAVDVLGVLSDFALYTSFGAVANTSISGVYGKIGSHGGAISGFGAAIVIGSTHSVDALTTQAEIDLDNAYLALMALPNTITGHAPAFGSGETVGPGVYYIPAAGSLAGTITLDAQGDPDAIFVFKFGGAFSVAAASKVLLTNGARRCNIFWLGGAGVATGAVTIGALSVLKGTFFSHGGACNTGANVFLAGRQLSTAGAVNFYSGTIYNNPGCVTSTSLTCVQPAQPATACYETAVFNATTCSWDVTGTQATEPATACYETATFNSSSCAWDVTGTQAAQPATACYETATFNTASCEWGVTGTQAAQPVIACYETATFNTTSCAWDVTGTQAAQPATACYETATFNTASCEWGVTGTQAAEPVTACYETATFNTTSCAWDVTGTQAAQPVIACYETATFHTESCEWGVTGTQAAEPVTACYETATFNTASCEWVVTGTQAVQPVTSCYEIATFNTTTCEWDLTETESLLTVSSYSGTILCHGGNTLVHVSVNGGTSPYSGIGSFAVGAGTYFYTVTDANGCSASTSGTVTEPTEMVLNIVGTDLYSSESIDVSISVSGGSAPYSYLWSQGGNTTSSINNLIAGTYCVDVTDANGCHDSDCYIVEPDVMSNPFTEGERESESEMNIYPNPASGLVTIKYPVQDLLSSTHLLIFDAAGRLVYSLKLDNLSETIMLDLRQVMQNHVSGLYLVRVTNGNHVYSKKITFIND